MKFLVVLLAVLALAAAKKFHADASFSVSSSIEHYAGNYRPGQKVDCYAKLDDAQVAAAQGNNVFRPVVESEAHGYVHIALYPLNGLVKHQVKLSSSEKFGSEVTLENLSLYPGVRGVEESSDSIVELLDLSTFTTESTGQFWLDDARNAQRLLNNGVFAAVSGTVGQGEESHSTFLIRGQVICQAKDHAEVSSSLKSVKTD